MSLGSKPCPRCGAAASVIAGPKNAHGLCLVCKTLTPLPRQKRNISLKNVVRAVGCITGIAVAVQVWMPERKHPLPSEVAIAIDRSEKLDAANEIDRIVKQLHYIEPVK